MKKSTRRAVIKKGGVPPGTIDFWSTESMGDIAPYHSRLIYKRHTLLSLIFITASVSVPIILIMFPCYRHLNLSYIYSMSTAPIES